MELSANGKQHKVLELNEREELPNWLWENGVCQWERARRWAIQRALAMGVPHVTLLVVLDEGEGDSRPIPASVSQLVNYALENEKVKVQVLKLKELLK
ncbi:MAG: hypothetical protein KDD06_08275 [Phaeodactylibacter sp.]|nr:hypothetical protein [Phaeodactylibacter sp.]MCB0585304.1 hypothetical protein [Phaeodactylibacter sp.]MCB9050099.1 hypothetical protein [Lewinellaceae bacterium]